MPENFMIEEDQSICEDDGHNKVVLEKNKITFD